MAERLILITGGVSLPRRWPATTRCARVLRHRMERGDDWQTVEEPLDIAHAQ